MSKNKEQDDTDDLPFPATAAQRSDDNKGWRIRTRLCMARERILTAHGAGIMPTNKISENSTEAASDGASLHHSRPHFETTSSGFIERIVVENDAPAQQWGPVESAIDRSSPRKHIVPSVHEDTAHSNDGTAQSDASTILIRNSRRRFRKVTSYVKHQAWPNFRHFFKVSEADCGSSCENLTR